MIFVRRAGAVAVAATLLLGSHAGAQRTANACRVDSAASWFRKQRAWLDDSRHDWSDDAARAGLVRAARLDDGRSLPVQMGWQIETGAAGARGDSAIERLRTLATTRGSVWPTKSVVGAAGVRAVWLIAQRDSGLARAALKRMMEAGPEESPAADVAVLEDRVRLASGRKQIYGTQFRATAQGALVVAPMEDSAHVDLRREDAGLPRFTTSACLARGAQR